MSETDPGRSDQHAGTVGARRATVGTPTDHESINVPPTRPGAAENAHEAELAREEHETFIPEAPQVDDRTDAVESRAVEEESLSGGRPAKGTGTARREHHGGHREHQAHGDDADEVRADIRQTRQELGETVSALAHKADVKSRAAATAATARGKAGRMAGTAKDKATEMAETAKDKATEMAETAKGKTAEMTGAAKGKAHEMTGKAQEVAGKVGDATPEPVKKRPVLMIAAVGTVVALLVRRVMRRNRAK
ncbi:DUF3618 domain-containing protein [Nonomuraea sp. SBT364]|uniref:DUF3618 domain-containing protein n=1 Tax=Nonomuraea sp. SBT364 TaxID=1580530 RepID=UPI00066A4B8E|nr:DUF3618 domain-containing protein [Nonomuraea sp. SBT364]